MKMTKDMDEQESICLNCIYGNQPYGYYPIVCVHGKRSREMWHDKTKCKHFEPCPEEVTDDDDMDIDLCDLKDFSAQADLKQQEYENCKI